MGDKRLRLLRHRLINGWPLFFMITGLTLGGMITGVIMIGFSTPESIVQLIRLSVRFASPWIFIAFSTSALVVLYPGSFSKWLLRNRRYTGLSLGSPGRQYSLRYCLRYTLPITGMNYTRPLTFWGAVPATYFCLH